MIHGDAFDPNSPLWLQMSEGRRTRIGLLDGASLDILVQPRLEVAELLAIVASHVGLRGGDADLFGLAFADDAGRLHWLHPDRRVLDHDFPKKLTSPNVTLRLFHAVKSASLPVSICSVLEEEVLLDSSPSP